MTSTSHLASSAFFYLAATALLESSVNIEGLAVTAVGSLLPDIDTPTSSIGRPFFPLARWINQNMGHRTVTHSLLGVASFAALVLGVDLPPRTSPPSMLDPGPFEVHSKGLDPVPAT